MQNSEIQAPGKENEKENVIEKEVGTGPHPVTEKFNDLCVSCNHLSLCQSKKNTVRPVYFCEEFDDYIPPLSKIVQQEKKTTAYKDRIDNPNLGLCMNCAHRDDCGYSKSEGGIWHCEEYA